jgi:cytochrome c oxidase subunit 2
MRPRILSVGLTAATLALLSGAAGATVPEPWQMGLQAPAGPIMEHVTSFHDLLLWIVTFIVLLVLALLVYTCVRFRESRNPEPSRRSHHTLLEVAWTAVPVLILVVVAVPSFKLLYYSAVVPETELTVKAVGHQWYWSYEYPDNGGIAFDAIMVTDDALQPGQRRLLETDNRVVLPVGTNIRLQVTAADVIHSWAMPSMGVKIDAVPGRLNEIWLHFDRPGTYYGQCSELCGVNHGFMPIAVAAVSKEEFTAWAAKAQARLAPSAPTLSVAAGSE